MDKHQRQIERYIEAHSTPESPLLKQLERVTNLRAVQPQMSSGRMQGAFLTFLTAIIDPKYILEIGTYTGYSTLCFAEGLEEDGIIDTIEVNDEIQSISGPFFSESPHAGRITQHTGPALQVAPTLGRVYDLVFIDGSKREYPDYYKMIMGDGGASGNKVPMVSPGSYILADNILWYGKVVDPQAHPDLHTASIDQFNKMVADDPRVTNFILPVRDGLNIIKIL